MTRLFLLLTLSCNPWYLNEPYHAGLRHERGEGVRPDEPRHTDDGCECHSPHPVVGGCVSCPDGGERP